MQHAVVEYTPKCAKVKMIKVHREAAAAYLRRTLGYGWESRLDNHTSTVW
jgi:hypothetical protein